MDKNDVGAGFVPLKIGDTVQEGDQIYSDFSWPPVPKRKIGTVLQRMHWPMRRKAPVAQAQEIQVLDAPPLVDPGPGWRLLDPGDLILPGDEFKHHEDPWEPTCASRSDDYRVGQRGHHFPYRRKLPETLAQAMDAGIQATIQDAEARIAEAPKPEGVRETMAALFQVPASMLYGDNIPPGSEIPAFHPSAPGAKILDNAVLDCHFLQWVADRLVHVYKESENIDFVRHLRALAKKLPELPKPFTPNKYTRDLLSLDGRRVPVDVYSVSGAFALAPVIQNEEVLDALFHARKKILAPGQRGAKGVLQDLKEARQSLDRAIRVMEEG